jgi:hypothetical protein
MYDGQERPVIKVGFRIDPQLNSDFNLIAAQLHMSINEAHVEAVKQFVYTKGTELIKRNIEIERKKLDALETYLLQIEIQPIIEPVQEKQAINDVIRRELHTYVQRIDRSFNSTHIIEYASMVANKNKLGLKDILNELKESVIEQFPDNFEINRRYIIIESAIQKVNA